MKQSADSKHPSGQVLRWIRNSVILILCSAVIGTLLLILVSMIPQSAIYENVMVSSEVLYEEGSYPNVFSGGRGSQLDNFTDGLMINTAYTSSGNLLEDALLGTRIRYEDSDLDPMESLYAYLYENDDSYTIWTAYGRYWNGYQVYLKPLLTVLSYPHIRSLNMALQLTAMFALFYALMKKKQERLCIPVFVMWICLCPAALFSSLQFASVYYPTIMLSILLVWKHDRLLSMQRCMLFELCGIVVAYLDLLTYPLVSLGIPLILYFAMDYDSCRSVKERVIQGVSCSASWAAGYACMWASKWVIASVLTGEDVISNAISQIGVRTSHFDGDAGYTWFGVIFSNAANFLSMAVVCVVLAALIAFGVFLLKYKRVPINVPAVLAICVVCCFPFVWYLILMNHSGVHHWFTYRELVISIFGVFALLFVQLDTGTRRGVRSASGGGKAKHLKR